MDAALFSHTHRCIFCLTLEVHMSWLIRLTEEALARACSELLQTDCIAAVPPPPRTPIEDYDSYDFIDLL